MPILRRTLGVLAASVLALGVLFIYLVYTPAPFHPRLNGRLTASSIVVGGLKRTYVTYVPHGLPKGAPLVVVMHGSGEDGRRMRVETGYGFERLADEKRFAVVYPDAYDGYWNVCSIVGNEAAGGRAIDDVGFLAALVGKLAGEIGIDPQRVFATGSSRGGSMALRLALEAPSRFRAVAAVSANVPVKENFQCRWPGQGTPSVMLMNGTMDPLVPFDGGEVSLFGLFYKNGKVLSARQSAKIFADLNHMEGPPAVSDTRLDDGVKVERTLWRNGAKTDVELVAIQGGGHGIPQPWRRHPRILGPSLSEPNGPAVIWDFFARQAAR